MEKAKKIKLFLGLMYFLIIISFLFLIFSKFSISDFKSYELIQSNTEHLNKFKNSNLILLSISFILFTIFWVLMLGFGSPIFLVGGFLFGKWLGTLLVTFSLTVGATILYIIANYMFKEIIIEKFYKKFLNLSEKFKKNEFTFMLIYRFIGGIPFFIANILPTLFNIKIKNYFFGTLLGILPQIFVLVSMGSGIEKIISNNLDKPSFYQILGSPDIYYPITAFIIIFLLSLFVKKFFYNK